jgi:hypothetical protein
MVAGLLVLLMLDRLGEDLFTMIIIVFIGVIGLYLLLYQPLSKALGKQYRMGEIILSVIHLGCCGLYIYGLIFGLY